MFPLRIIKPTKIPSCWPGQENNIYQQKKKKLRQTWNYWLDQIYQFGELVQQRNMHKWLHILVGLVHLAHRLDPTNNLFDIF